MNRKKQEQKDKKKKKRPKNQDRTLPPDFDMAKPYFVRASQETDMCEVERRTHIGVPLIGEDQEPYRREWIIPPKATYLEGAHPKSEPMQPWHLRDPSPSIPEEDGSSS